MTLKKLLTCIFFVCFFDSSFSQSRGELEKKVDSLIIPLVSTNNYSGTILISKDGNTLVSKTYGKMNRDYNLDNTPETKFFLASASMIFTSTAIMKLVEKGMISLNDTLSKFIPEYKRAGEITIQDMLAQRSGIPAIGSGSVGYYDSITKFTHTADQLISHFKNYDLLFKPGTKYNHGRSDYILLARIIEKLSGKSFGEFLNVEIFSPLNMVNSGHYSGEALIVPNLAKGYTAKGLYDLESAYQIDWSSKTGHASIYSTVTDLQKFGQAVLQNKLLSKTSWGKILTDYGEKNGYGWFISNHGDHKRYQMNGRSPGFSSYFGVYPDEKLVVIMLSNIDISLPSVMGKPLASIIFKEPYGKLNLTDQGLNAEYGHSLTGTYKFGENFYVPNFDFIISYKEGKLHSSWGGLIPVNEGDKNFKKFIIRKYWGSLEFTKNTNGVTEIIIDGHKGVKVK